MIEAAATKLRQLGWHELADRLGAESPGTVLNLVWQRAERGSLDGLPYERETLESIFRECRVSCK
jgi:hypothetical protein